MRDIIERPFGCLLIVFFIIIDALLCLCPFIVLFIALRPW
jgi:hypothetical protein